MPNPFFDLESDVAQEIWRRVGAECVQGAYELSTNEHDQVLLLAEEASRHHRLRGAWSHEHNLVVLQLLDHDRIAEWKSGEVSCLLWGSQSTKNRLADEIN